MVAPLLIGAGTLLASEMLRDRGGDSNEYLNRAYNLYGGLDVPTAEELQYKLEQLQLQGIITPEQVVAIQQDPSLLQQIVGSPEAQGAQMQALKQLQGIDEEGGLTAADKATMAELQAQGAGQARGAREALDMRSKERGISGSGLDVVSQMIAQQEAATRGSQYGLDVAKQAQQRALEAIMQSGQLGGQIRGQQFGEESAKAAAQDAINRFNVANRQNVGAQNVQARNLAQEKNLASKQRIADTNVGLANQKSAADAAAVQQTFTDKVTKIAGQTGQLKGMTDIARDRQDSENRYKGTMIGTGGQLLSDYFNKKKKVQ